jgi:hypothetical protein
MSTYKKDVIILNLFCTVKVAPYLKLPVINYKP